MASKYFRAGVTNWDADASWSTTSGGVADTTKPTAADDVFLNASSANCTINAAAFCRSINCTGYTGTLSHGAFTVTIGDATAGASNIALKFVAGMTYQEFSATRAFDFISTSATVQTIDFAGKQTGNLTFNSTSNGSYQFTGAHTSVVSAITTLTKGTLDINGQTCSWGSFVANGLSTRSLTLGAASITITGTGTCLTTGTDTGSITFSGASSTITLNSTSGGRAITSNTSCIFGTIVDTGSGGLTLNTALSCANFTRTGTAIKTDSLSLSGNLTCSGTFTCNGNSTINRVLVQSSTVGTARTITAATWAVTNTDFQDITGAGAGSRDFSAQTDVGNCGGNSGITFPASVAQTATMSTNQNWSTAGIWTSRVPLPQDDVVMTGVTGGTLTADMPRLGRSISWTGATGSPTWAIGSVSNSIFGSITLISGMSLSGTNTTTLAGRSNYSITSAGLTFTPTMQIVAPSGTYSLNDALNVGNTNFTLTNGSFVDNGFSFTGSKFLSANSNVRSVTATGTYNLASTAALTLWDFSTATNLTFTGSTSTIVFTAASANTRTFAGGGKTFGTLTYTVAGSTGELDITGSNSFAQINFSDVTNARSLKFTAGTTTTIRNGNGFNVQGTAGKLMTVSSITGATHTLASTSRQVCSYLNVSYSIASAGLFYAQTTSTDGLNNTNWIFTDAPILSVGGGSNGIQNRMNLQNLRSLV